MNANQIHIGTEYAIAPYTKGNTTEFIPNAHRLKAMRVFGETEPGNTRLTMYVEGFKLDYEGNITSTTYVKYRVRDIIEDWEDYEDRKEQWEVEQSAKERERQLREAEYRERMDREREAREAREQDRVQRVTSVKLKLKDIGLTPVPYDHYYRDEQLTFSLKDLQAWLDTLQREDCNTCNRTLVKITLPQGVNV